MFNEDFNFQCASNKIIIGMATNYEMLYQDRRYKFLCAADSEKATTNCYVTHFLNQLESALDQMTIPSGQALVGFVAVRDVTAK